MPISTFDRSKDNSKTTNTWPEKSAKMLHTVQKYVPQLAIQTQRAKEKLSIVFGRLLYQHLDG